MIASAVESFIKKFCGRYLKNFGAENLKIELLKITLINIEIRAEEFNRFQLPFSPEKITIEKIEVDLPLIIGSTFKAVIRGLSINLKRVASASYDDSVVQSMIQNWIAFFYFSLLSLSHGYNSIRKNLGRGTHSNSKLSSADLENYQRLFEQLEVHLYDIHVNLLDNINDNVYHSHNSAEVGFGFRVVSLVLRPPSTDECGMFAGTSAPTVHDSKILVLKKIFKCCGLRVYCRRESDLASGDILEDLSFTAAMSVCFQKITQVFGPAFLSVNAENIRVHLTDEQLFAMNRVAQIFRTYFYDLRSQSRIALCHQRSLIHEVDRSRKAQMRWGLIRNAVRIDWWKFADHLAESDAGGSIKWRSWFSIWRLAARYVAIRELITYHVGYESFTNSDTGATTYAAKEKLMMQYERLQKDKNSRSQLYEGPACFPVELLTAVELIIASRYKNIDDINAQLSKDVEIDRGEVVRLSDIDPLNLPNSVIKVLYALQLELDSILPFKISAFCRIYADEKCELRNRLQMVSVSDGENDAGDLLNNPGGTNFVSGATLFVGVVHATNLKPSFVSTSVSSFCALESDLWLDNETVVVYTSNAVGKVNPTSGVAFTVWGEAFSLPLSGELVEETFQSTVSNAPQKVMNEVVTITCYNKGVFNISYGSRSIYTKSFLTPADQAAIVALYASRNGAQAPPPYLGSIESSNAILHSTFLNTGQPYSGETGVNTNAVNVRIITCCAVGSAEHLTTCAVKFKEKLKEITDEQQLMLERQSQLRLHEDDDEESQFILDPSLLTIQDFKIKVSLPKFEIVASLVPCPPEGEAIAAKPLTILKVLLDRILIQGTVSNNPWNISASGLVGRVNIEMLQEEGKEFDEKDIETELESILMLNNRKVPNSKLCMLPVLSLPRIQAHVQFSQTSTLARKLDGSLDSSCFDYTASISAFPLTMSFHPQAAGGGMANSNSWANIWKAKNPLSHLFLTRMQWSKGFSSSHCAMEGKAACIKPEAESHLGRKYEPYPKHLNVVTSLWASARAWMKRGQQRYQTTSIKCSTPVRALDVEFTFPTETHTASCAVNEASPVKSIPLQTADSNPAHSGAAPPLNFFDWFGYHTSTATATATAAAPAAKIETTVVPIEASYVEPEEVAEERKALFQRIEELEKRNTFLETMLKHEQAFSN